MVASASRKQHIYPSRVNNHRLHSHVTHGVNTWGVRVKLEGSGTVQARKVRIHPGCTCTRCLQRAYAADVSIGKGGVTC